MKKIFNLFIVLFTISNISFSQKLNLVKPQSREEYLIKSQKQKKMGWRILGLAVVVGTLPLLFKRDHPSDNPYYFYNDKNKTAAILVVTATGLSSIPFFISSSKNKKKAVGIALHNENTNIPREKGFALKTMPTVTLIVGL